MSTQASTASPAVFAEIRVPRETVNDDTVTIQEWHTAHGARVTPKQLVVSIETSKAVLEVEAEAEGFVQIIHARGAEVPIGELIGRIVSEPGTPAPGLSPPTSPAPSAAASTNGHPTAPSPSPARSSNRLRRPPAPDVAAQNADAPAPSDPGAHVLPARQPAAPAVSKKAQALIDEHGLDPQAVFAGMGLVREVDVIRYLESRIADHQREHPTPPSPAAVAAAQPPSPRAAAATVNSAYSTRPRGLLGDAAASARDRGNRSVLWLAWNYFWRNWLLGNLARWAPRGVILPIHRMRGVKMGRDVFIDPTAIIETAFPENITIGDDVRITAGCVIMSHIKAPHYLRETGLVPVVLKPVILEDHCFIGVNSVIMPGVTVGRASVVASGSVVVTNVPPYTMVQGNPAKVIKQFPKPEEGTEAQRHEGTGS